MVLLIYRCCRDWLPPSTLMISIQATAILRTSWFKATAVNAALIRCRFSDASKIEHEYYCTGSFKLGSSFSARLTCATPATVDAAMEQHRRTASKCYAEASPPAVRKDPRNLRFGALRSQMEHSRRHKTAARKHQQAQRRVRSHVDKSCGPLANPSRTTSFPLMKTEDQLTTCGWRPETTHGTH